MPSSLSLNGPWSLSWNDDFPEFLTAESLSLRTQLAASVPEPVHTTLLRQGLLDDPNVGLNSLRARWVEEQFWVYRKTFRTPESAGDSPAWLVFDLLEYDAIVWLNGREIGRHASAHVPARFRIDEALKPAGEENVLVVRVDAGLFGVADLPADEYMSTPCMRLTKRQWQRKGQWQCGWDWQQRLMNVGILGDVRLEWSDAPCLLQTSVYALPGDDLSRARFLAKVVVFNPEPKPVQSSLRIVVQGTGADGVMYWGGLLPVGESLQEVETTITEPQLWWPVGHGEPHRYDVEITFTSSSDRAGAHERLRRLVGVRKIEVDQSPHPETGRHFILKINDKPIFCKGGNWVPPDMLHSTVTRERLAELVDLALGASFNLLRIWGGGTWAGHDLLDLCDEKGLLVWHDLLFACAKFPGDQPAFAAKARHEVQWGFREFAHHPSLVVWCGNNEIEEGDWNWGYDRQGRTHPHYALFHHDFPKLAKTEAPHVFYWISSPFSPDYADPTDPTVGDQHPWGVSLRQNGPTDWRAYRQYVDRFPNEGGVLGASSPATLRQFLPEDQRYLNSPVWDHHDNPFAMNPMTPGQPGRAYQTVTFWTGRDPAAMDWEEYAFASALLQAEGLTEYITNYRRRMFSSSAAIFWMYNDSWPVTHGWTIVDYWRRKKLAYHPVRRAFQPVTVVCAELEDGRLGVFGVNETDDEWRGRLTVELALTDGDTQPPTRPVRLPARTSTLLRRTSLRADSLAAESGRFRDVFYAALFGNDGGLVAQHRLLFHRFHELNLDPNPQIETTLADGMLTLLSDVFVWGVCLDLDGERPVADNAFDLLPGVPYSLPWDEAALGPPEILRTGNALLQSSQ